MDKTLRELVARERIRDCLYRYSRGIDRCDRELVRSAYWPDACLSQLDYNGDPEGFIAWAFPQIQALDLITHHIGNVLIQWDEEVVAESTFMSYRRFSRGDQKSDQLGGGRYLDKFQQRGEDWRIVQRLVVVDWARDFSALGNSAEQSGGVETRHPKDVSYAWFRPSATTR